MKASGGPHGHRQVWARDSMITLLGASLVEDDEIRSTLLASLESLKRHQTPAGCIPNHVDVESGRPNYRAYADGGLWFVAGSSILAPDYAAIRRTLDWYGCQDTDQSGLIGIQEASDWQDLLCTRGQGLYVNCLYVVALNRAAAAAENAGHRSVAAAFRKRAGAVRDAINGILWYAGDGDTFRHLAHTFSTQNNTHDSLGRRRWIPAKKILIDSSYYLHYLSFREIGERFDCFGNLLAILSGVAGAGQTERILDFIEGHELDRRPLCALYPPIQPGEPEWRDYYGELNRPHQYHNGGVWPFLGGFYVAALVKAGRYRQAAQALDRLAELVRNGGFNEWHHGKTGQPMGANDQAWSAGMFLYACESVARGQAPFFGDALPNAV